MITELYLEQLKTWEQTGKHILAQYDDNSIIVYQAYRPSIAEYAIKHQKFGGDFKLTRMSWIKPNFLWMMYRCGWATKEGQEYVLGIRLTKTFFDEILRSAVVSSFEKSDFENRETWQQAVDTSDVRLQWDPDHDPLGNQVERRAVQLGLRGDILRRYAEQEILEIIDMTPFVIEQRQHLDNDFEKLIIPKETLYIPNDEQAIKSVGIDRK